jgi:hypothetical protein
MRSAIAILICIVVIACALSLFLSYARADDRDPRCALYEAERVRYKAGLVTYSKTDVIAATALYNAHCKRGRRSAAKAG